MTLAAAVQVAERLEPMAWANLERDGTLYPVVFVRFGDRVKMPRIMDLISKAYPFAHFATLSQGRQPVMVALLRVDTEEQKEASARELVAWVQRADPGEIAAVILVGEALLRVGDTPEEARAAAAMDAVSVGVYTPEGSTAWVTPYTYVNQRLAAGAKRRGAVTPTPWDPWHTQRVPSGDPVVTPG